MRVIDVPWIYNMELKSTGYWTGGYIIDAGDGKKYKCKIKFVPKDSKNPHNMLDMRGEIGLGIGRTQHWVETTEEEAMAAKALND